MEIPALPIGHIGEVLIAWITAHCGAVINGFGAAVTSLDSGILDVLIALPFFVIIAGIGALAWYSAGLGLAIFATVGLLGVANQGLWLATMKTLALVLTTASLSLLVALPIGIAMTESTAVRATITPILNFLQTMPRFVYLIPAVTLLGIDVAPAVFASMTLAVIPPARLTALGILSVSGETIEAANSMGCTRLQLLWKVKLPLAIPAIMLGVNQCIMMCLSMVIIASLIGASGLGDEILMAIAVLDPGRGLVAGFAVLVLAITLDRMTRGWVSRAKGSKEAVGIR